MTWVCGELGVREECTPIIEQGVLVPSPERNQGSTESLGVGLKRHGSPLGPGTLEVLWVICAGSCLAPCRTVAPEKRYEHELAESIG